MLAGLIRIGGGAFSLFWGGVGGGAHGRRAHTCSAPDGALVVRLWCASCGGAQASLPVQVEVAAQVAPLIGYKLAERGALVSPEPANWQSLTSAASPCSAGSPELAN